MTDPLAEVIERYVSLWNEPDADVRRKTIEELWMPDGANYTQSLEAIGYDALETRVAAAYAAYVGTGVYRFRSLEAPVEHHNAAKVQWEMVAVADGQVASMVSNSYCSTMAVGSFLTTSSLCTDGRLFESAQEGKRLEPRVEVPPRRALWHLPGHAKVALSHFPC